MLLKKIYMLNITIDNQPNNSKFLLQSDLRATSPFCQKKSNDRHGGK